MPNEITIPRDPEPPLTSGGPDLIHRMVAEAIGTMVLVGGGIGTAILAAVFPSANNNVVGVGHLGVALAFGLTVVVGAYAFGPISGGHFNPAITLGVAASDRFPGRTPSATSSPRSSAASSAPR